jgi:hypothetical protein
VSINVLKKRRGLLRKWRSAFRGLGIKEGKKKRKGKTDVELRSDSALRDKPFMTGAVSKDTIIGPACM